MEFTFRIIEKPHYIDDENLSFRDIGIYHTLIERKGWYTSKFLKIKNIAELLHRYSTNTNLEEIINSLKNLRKFGYIQTK